MPAVPLLWHFAKEKVAVMSVQIIFTIAVSETVMSPPFLKVPVTSAVLISGLGKSAKAMVCDFVKTAFVPGNKTVGAAKGPKPAV